MGNKTLIDKISRLIEQAFFDPGRRLRVHILISKKARVGF